MRSIQFNKSVLSAVLVTGALSIIPMVGMAQVQPYSSYLHPISGLAVDMNVGDTLFGFHTTNGTAATPATVTFSSGGTYTLAAVTSLALLYNTHKINIPVPPTPTNSGNTGNVGTASPWNAGTNNGDSGFVAGWTNSGSNLTNGFSNGDWSPLNLSSLGYGGSTTGQFS